MGTMDTKLNELITVISDESDAGKALQLIKSGVDVNRSTAAGCTPLMFSVMPNEFGDHNTAEATRNMVEALLGFGADPRPTDRFGMTASDYANQWIDPEWKDRFGESALERLSTDDVEIFKRVIKLLEQSAKDEHGAFHLEVQQYNHGCFQRVTEAFSLEPPVFRAGGGSKEKKDLVGRFRGVALTLDSTHWHNKSLNPTSDPWRAE